MNFTKYLASVSICTLVAACGGSTTTTVPTPGGSVEVKQSGERVTVTDNKSGVQVTAGTELPADFPKDLVYPGQTGISNSVSASNGTAMVAFQTSDNGEKAMVWYKDAVAKSGWTIETTMTAGTTIMLHAKKGTQSLTVQFIPGVDGPPALIQVAIGQAQN